MSKKTNPGHGLQMVPLVIKRCRGITADIPNMFPASGAPTAPPIIRFYDFSSFSHSSQESWRTCTLCTVLVVEINPNHRFSRFSENLDLHWKIKVVHSLSKTTLGYLRLAYASRNDARHSGTVYVSSGAAHAASGGRRRRETNSDFREISKSLNFHGFLVNFHEIHGTMCAYPTPTDMWGASTPSPECRGVVFRRVCMPSSLD